jgi:hypothetical protein
LDDSAPANPNLAVPKGSKKSDSPHHHPNFFSKYHFHPKGNNTPSAWPVHIVDHRGWDFTVTHGMADYKAMLSYLIQQNLHHFTFYLKSDKSVIEVI